MTPVAFSWLLPVVLLQQQANRCPSIFHLVTGASSFRCCVQSISHPDFCSLLLPPVRSIQWIYCALPFPTTLRSYAVAACGGATSESAQQFDLSGALSLFLLKFWDYLAFRVQTACTRVWQWKAAKLGGRSEAFHPCYSGLLWQLFTKSCLHTVPWSTVLREQTSLGNERRLGAVHITCINFTYLLHSWFAPESLQTSQSE